MSARLPDDEVAVLINNGVPVIPMKDKRPLLSSWRDRPARPPTADELDQWFPGAEPGALLGDSFAVIDVDEHGDVSGLDSLHYLEQRHQPLPRTWRAITPSGGLHIWFRAPEGVTLQPVTVIEGVELRTGRQVVACPPGVGREWEIPPSETALAELPDWIVKAARQNAQRTARPPAEPGAAIAEGQRNSTLASLAGTMRRRGMGASEITAALLVTNRERCRPPLTDQEVAQIAQSIGRYQPPTTGLQNGPAEPSLKQILDADPGPEPTPGESAPGGFKARAADASAFYPVTFAWERRLVRGVINIFAGEEGVGKGTLEAWVIARLTRGELPGHFRQNPVRVLWIGDEDGFRQVVGPRLHAAGADLAYVSEVVGDNGSLLNITTGAEQLDRLIVSGPFEVVVFEQLLDNLGVFRNPNDPYEVRAALRPMRHILHRRETTVTATLHINKMRTGDFRSRLGGSHQYNAVSRSSLLIAHHPDGSGQRVLVGGKANYSAPPVPLAFEVRSHRFELNGFEFEVPLACEFAEAPDLDIETVLEGPSKPRPRDEVAGALREAIRAVASCQPLKGVASGNPGWTLTELAQLVGRKATDGTVRRVVDELVEEGVLQRGQDKRYRPAPTLFDNNDDRETAGEEQHQ
jgi:hypothetical protein